MKIGDRVRSTKVRSEDFAVIKKVDIDIKKRSEDVSNVKTKYVAEYPDGSELTFYGFNIGKTIFAVDDYEQLSLFDIYKEA